MFCPCQELRERLHIVSQLPLFALYAISRALETCSLMAATCSGVGSIRSVVAVMPGPVLGINVCYLQSSLRALEHLQ